MSIQFQKFSFCIVICCGFLIWDTTHFSKSCETQVASHFTTWILFPFGYVSITTSFVLILIYITYDDSHLCRERSLTVWLSYNHSYIFILYSCNDILYIIAVIDLSDVFMGDPSVQLYKSSTEPALMHSVLFIYYYSLSIYIYIIWAEYFKLLHMLQYNR